MTETNNEKKSLNLTHEGYIDLALDMMSEDCFYLAHFFYSICEEHLNKVPADCKQEYIDKCIGAIIGHPHKKMVQMYITDGIKAGWFTQEYIDNFPSSAISNWDKRNPPAKQCG